MMSRRCCPALGQLHRIFCTLARIWERDFKVLAVPHHAQVFALLVFKASGSDDFGEVNHDGGRHHFRSDRGGG